MLRSSVFDRSTVLVWTLAAILAGGAHPSSAGDPSRKTGVVDYAPHVRIDWSRGQVEVDGRIVLREGSLELFACSPQTREHESIVAIGARPQRVYEALGLLGVTPGHPVRLVPGTERWEAATGDALRIEARWEREGHSHAVDIGEWMRDVGTGRPLPPGIWRFAGSTRDARGNLTADADGTVVCVVDFASALIALAEMKTASNDALWVRAHASAIPPIDTRVTLVISRVEAAAFEVRVDAGGTVFHNHKSVPMERLIDRIERFERDHERTRIVIHVDFGATPVVVERVRDSLRKAIRRGTPVLTAPAPNEAKVDRPPTGGDSEPQ